MAAPQWTSQPVNEGSTALLKIHLVDPDGLAIPGTSLDTASLTLYDELSGDVINSRDSVNVKSLVDANGLLTFELTPSDQVILNTALANEYHRALVRYSWTYAGPPITARSNSLDARVIVRNINYLPTVGSP